MSKFRHPHLTRGIVHTSTGAFAVCRGIIDAPDSVGEEFGWLRIDEENPANVRAADSAGITKIDPAQLVDRLEQSGVWVESPR